MSNTEVPLIPLSSGTNIPQIGFGVFQVDPSETERIVSEALEAGYRHIDTASAYGNEEAVGRAIASSGISRNELFVTTKLFREHHGFASALAALPASLERLGLESVDLYLIHWPAPARDAYVESWRAFERLQAAQLTRAIGVCNFLPEHLDRLIAETDVVPVVNQIELHPRFQQVAERNHHERLGIVTQAWAPLGQGKYALDELPGVGDIAARHGKTPAQIILAWHLHENRIIFPKTVRRERMIENLDVFDIALHDNELAVIRALDADMRIGAHPYDRN